MCAHLFRSRGIGVKLLLNLSLKLAAMAGVNSNQQRCITVLGMHRSGTSVLMGSLRDAGVHVGQVLDQPFALNRRGLQEAPSLLYMHEQLLKDNGGSWHQPPSSVIWDKLHQSIRDLFIESRRAEPIWGFKDPRTLLTLEGWLDVIPEMECVGIFRHPNDVARSLHERNGFETTASLNLWEHYNRRLLMFCRQRLFPVIEFHADARFVKEGLSSILRSLDLCDASIDAANAFYDPSEPREKLPDNELPPHINDLYEELRKLATSHQSMQEVKTTRCDSMRPPQYLQPLSTRLFPKGEGAANYQITGIAKRCDWVVLSDTNEPSFLLTKLRQCETPRHVFLSLRSPFVALTRFQQEILPLITGPFTLITGSEDCTIPHQVDRRWRPFEAEERQGIQALLDDSRLISWWAENLDSLNHSKLRPLPLGLLPHAGEIDVCINVPEIVTLSKRPLRMLCAHRIREGVQWDVRRHVSDACRQHYQPWCTLLEHEVPEQDLLHRMRHHAFVICAEGGGLDPSPKAWQAILQGAIPIIRSSALDEAYRQLPVAIVSDWNSTSLAMSQLEEWVALLSPYFDDAEKRNVVLSKLGIDYWWNQIDPDALQR
jgi:hypothetical protein